MNEDYSGVERRKYKRIPVNFIVKYCIRKPMDAIMLIGNMEIKAVMIDLSEGGMAIITDYGIPLGTELALKFTLVDIYTSDQEDNNKIIETLGRVTYCTPIDKTNRIGISFTEISKQHVSTITDFVNRFFRTSQ